MIPLSTRLQYYKRQDIREAMVSHAQNREIAVKFGDSFGKRPEILDNPNDVLEYVKNGATSFHVSEEIWNNPLMLKPELRKQELDALRIGWDLVIDVDCPIWEYSKIITHYMWLTLKENGITAVSCKFSGNKGFHLGVPFSAFPGNVNEIETRLRFPDGVKVIASFLIGQIDKDKRLTKKILEKGFSDVLEKTGKTREELVHVVCEKCNKSFKTRPEKCSNCGSEHLHDQLNVEELIQVDTLLISSRHLYRMPYSLHEKSGLASLPIACEDILSFERNHADPLTLKIPDHAFLDDKNVEQGHAALLFDRAFHWHIENSQHQAFTEAETEKKRSQKAYDELTEALPLEYFPPCIHHLLAGITDGRKRALFVLVNFLRSTGYSFNEIDEMLHKWNEKNTEPLREVYLRGQIHYQKNKQAVLPPNCSNEQYMKGIGVCKPDGLCARIKNPAQYAKRKDWIAKNVQEQENKGKKKKKQAKEGTANSKSQSKNEHDANKKEESPKKEKLSSTKQETENTSKDNSEQ